MVSSTATSQAFVSLMAALCIAGTPPPGVEFSESLKEKIEEKVTRKIGQMENPEAGLELIDQVQSIRVSVQSICVTNTATRTRTVSRNKFTTVVIVMQDGTIHVGTASRNNYRAGDGYDPERGFMIALTRAFDALLGLSPK